MTKIENSFSKFANKKMLYEEVFCNRNDAYSVI